MVRYRPVIAALLGGLLVGGSATAAAARTPVHRLDHGRTPNHVHPAPQPAAPTGPAPDAPLAVDGMPPPPELANESSYILIDASTGAVLA